MFSLRPSFFGTLCTRLNVYQYLFSFVPIIYHLDIVVTGRKRCSMEVFYSSFKSPLYFLFSDSNKNNIYIKRDDLIPISFGGNKARKAMNFFKEIDQGGFDCVVTYGSGSSNHCRIVSNMAASRKLPCYIVAPKESSLPTFNSKMMELFGSHFMITPVNEVHDTIERLLATLKEEGKKSLFYCGLAGMVI